ncbi:N-succinyldiaminopimelate aminotransferase [Leifsonia sp. AK011]|uniref:aminotransferase class I/II-fold pyridoxal phosphate-dependent enzyme n=1 Tax=Leifsonia sp. AK011 TaxID=2723075 RepID=UPI0015CBD1B3|nr:aminotransferase class I/II-fold pyridoxal phosphate-dependent enzyme [Leifsonia sp. AK011]NYF10220.1 N-succinyldiaminopimelate aminotransferase [Leifsonia sp. AK011]
MTVSGSWERAARGAMLLGDGGELSPTIFAEMSALATATGAINLGQGFPDDDGPPEVLAAARQAISDGINQYPPGLGMPDLRLAISEHQQRFYGLAVDPDTEVLVTAGATEALAATILALTEEGDQVVVFEPFYDAYGATAALARTELVTVPLPAPDFRPDLDALRDAVTDRTRLIIVNSPHNPTGTIFDRGTLELIVELAHRHDAIIVTDEVYEHLTFGVPHVPIATLPGARERTVSISSGGKTFSTTGWKIGWITAPHRLLAPIIAVKQYLTYVNGGPFQPAIAVGLRLPDSYFEGAATSLAHRCALLSGGLRSAGFEVLSPQAGYFVIADAAPLGITDGAEFCRQLPARAGVVGVPVTAFVREEHRDGYRSLIRFAFCKREDVLERAASQLATLR